MSTAIVPYVARKSASLIAARYARAYLMRNKVAITRQALRSGIRFYKYAGAKIGLAAKRYLARRRKRRAPKYTRSMEPSTKKTCLAWGDQVPIGNVSTGIPQATLFVNPLDWPSFSATNTVRTRESLDVMLKGVKICRQFKYPAPPPTLEYTQPIMIHWALVQAKTANQAPNDFANEAATKFFRFNGDADDRTLPFPIQLSTSLWDMRFNCLPMNPDNNFNIIFHKKRMLNQEFRDSTGFKQPFWTTFWKIEKYVKFNKKFSFADTTTARPTHPIYEVMWYQAITPDFYTTGAGTSPPANASLITTQKMHTMYYGNVGK